MRRAIRAGEPGAVHHEGDRQVLQSDFLENLIVAALQERAVDVDDRPQTGLGLAGGKRDGVRFADAGIEKAIREFIANRFELVALAHGGGHHRHPFVVPHLVANRVAGDVGVRRRDSICECGIADLLRG